MYSRDQTKSTGAVKAFEDAFAKEDFLRRTGSQNNNIAANQRDEVHKKASNPEIVSYEEDQSRPNNYTAKRTGGLAGLFSDKDSGDMLLALLIIFFLFDSDKENDSIIPILLAVLFFF